MACTYLSSIYKDLELSGVGRGSARLRASLCAFGLGGLLALLTLAPTGCADTKPAIQYSAAQLLGFWNPAMVALADKHAGCAYERDLPFNHKEGACYPLKCKNSGDEASILRKFDGSVYKCDGGCDGGCSSIARF